jgi:hypothetical protein
MIVLATLYGYRFESALLYGVSFSVRALGIFLPFYCLKFYVEGAERFISAGWTTKEFTRKNYPYQFNFLIVNLILLAAACSISWITLPP